MNLLTQRAIGRSSGEIEPAQVAGGVTGAAGHRPGGTPAPGLHAAHRYRQACAAAHQKRHVERAALLRTDEGLSLEEQHGLVAGVLDHELGDDGLRFLFADVQVPGCLGLGARQVVRRAGRVGEHGEQRERPPHDRVLESELELHRRPSWSATCESQYGRGVGHP